MKSMNIKLIIGLVLLVALARLSPHPWNVTPVGALALFCGAYLPRRIAWLVPVCTTLAVDMMIGLYNPILMAFVYGAFACSTVIGSSWLSERRSVNRVGGAVLTGALAFYLISNIGPWLALYPLTTNGLIACYINALPFFGRSLVGDGVYAILFFGLFESIRYVTSRLSIRHANKK